MLVTAGVRDFYEYPSIITKFAEVLYVSYQQSCIIHTIIRQMLKNKKYSDELKSQSYFSQILNIEDSEIVQSIVQIVQIANGTYDDFECQMIDSLITNAKQIEFLFKSIRGIPKDSLYKETRESLFIFDEVCFRDNFQNPNIMDYQSVDKA
ncbi:Hypothetical_protein [Hexamita inflata]|uniref:Hypothetical_protein n=1 Tax=Hexamita inflata TaxID=28002 RepID=A0AA86NMR2_9EUKA|nr:Hypothetical protein HINF_LOCUS9335 [Hexamita inflata]